MSSQTTVPSKPKPRYNPPPLAVVDEVEHVRNLLSDRPLPTEKLQQRLALGGDAPRLHYAGELALLYRPLVVSVVGTRNLSPEGVLRARRIARELVAAGAVVMSGLAKGVDATAMKAAVEVGGRLIGVIGTPLSKAYPIENAALQEDVWRNHLLISPFMEGQVVRKDYFPHRNRVMAALSHATVIVEAGETSGTVHQAAECERIGRWLFILKSLADNPDLKWPKSFLRGYERARVLTSTQEVIDAVNSDRRQST